MSEVIRATDPVVLVRDYLQTRATANGKNWWVATEWTTRAEPLVLVSRAGGARINLVTDRPQMLVEIWAGDEAAGSEVGQIVESWISAFPIVNFAVRRIEWLSGPVSNPDNNKRSRVQMSFYLRVKMEVLQEA